MNIFNFLGFNWLEKLEILRLQNKGNHGPLLSIICLQYTFCTVLLFIFLGITFPTSWLPNGETAETLAISKLSRLLYPV